MSFSIVVFVAALWALSSEMIEDSLVNLIYGHLFGWRNLIYAVITASIILATLASVLIYYTSFILVAYIDLISKAAALLLTAIGIFWLTSSVIARREVSEAGEVGQRRRRKLTFLVALQLVSVEELEIFLILIPLILASYALEATSATAIGILASLSLALLLKRDFERFVVGRIRYLKIISGLFLIILGIILLLEI